MKIEWVKTLGIGIALSICAGATAQAKECFVGDFKTSINDDTHELNQLSYIYNMSEEQWNKSEKGLGLDIPTKAGVVGLDHSAMRSNLKKRAESLGIERFSEFSRAYVLDTLNDNDLKAYIECLRGGVGLNAAFSGISSSIAKITIQHNPHTSCNDNEKIFISDHNNLNSVKALERQIADRTSCDKLDLDEVVVRPVNIYESGYITVSVGGATRSIEIPPLRSKIPFSFGTLARFYETNECKYPGPKIPVIEGSNLRLGLGGTSFNGSAPDVAHFTIQGTYGSSKINETDFQVPVGAPRVISLGGLEMLVIETLKITECTATYRLSLS